MCESDDVQHLRGLLADAERLRDQARRVATAPGVDLDRDMRDDSLHADQWALADEAEAWFAEHDAHGQLNEALAAARDRRIDALLAQARDRNPDGGS